MKKRMVLLGVVLTMSVFMLTGCGKNNDAEKNNETNDVEVVEESASEEPVEEMPEEVEKNYLYLQDIKAQDYVTLGEYKGVEINKPKPQIEDEYLQSYVDYLLRKDPASGAIDGDTVILDYVGTLDGTAFPGGTAQGADLVLGSNSYIDGFEEGLIGAKVGETRELNLTFPEEYQEATLAGKEVVFTVTVTSIMAVNPQELTEEYVKGLGLSLNTVEEFNKYAYDQLYAEEQAAIDADMERTIIEAIVGKTEAKQELPKELTDRYIDTMVTNLTNQAAAYGLSFQDYMTASSGLEEEAYMSELEVEAKGAAMQYVVMQAIADQEGMTVAEEQITQEVTKLAQAAGYDDVESYRSMMDEKGFREYLMARSVIQMLTENTVIIEE